MVEVSACCVALFWSVVHIVRARALLLFCVGLETVLEIWAMVTVLIVWCAKINRGPHLLGFSQECNYCYDRGH